MTLTYTHTVRIAWKKKNYKTVKKQFEELKAKYNLLNIKHHQEI